MLAITAQFPKLKRPLHIYFMGRRRREKQKTKKIKFELYCWHPLKSLSCIVQYTDYGIWLLERRNASGIISKPDPSSQNTAVFASDELGLKVRNLAKSILRNPMDRTL